MTDLQDTSAMLGERGEFRAPRARSPPWFFEQHVDAAGEQQDAIS